MHLPHRPKKYTSLQLESCTETTNTDMLHEAKTPSIKTTHTIYQRAGKSLIPKRDEKIVVFKVKKNDCRWNKMNSD